MAWENLTKIDLSWIAGIFEGEGSICVYKGSGEKTKYIRLLFFNNDITMLEEVQRMIGGHLHIRTHRRKDDWVESHQLQLGKKEDILNFQKYIFPYFRTQYKKEQFTKAINLANENGGDY